MTFGSTFGRTFSPTFQPKSQAAKAGIVVYDTFTDTNGVLLSNHTPEIYPAGSTWGGGTATTDTTIRGNAAESQCAYATNSGCGIVTGLADCKITANVSGHNSPNTTYRYRGYGIKVRCSSAANGSSSDTATWYAVLIAAANDEFYILEKASGDSYTTRATTSVTINKDQVYLMTITLSGATITATLDGANEISYSSATTNQTSTIHGVKPSSYGTFYSYVYDFKVESI